MTRGRKPKERVRAYLREKEQEIADYIMKSPRTMDRTELAEKMLGDMDWGAKPPEIEVLVKKISNYRNMKPSPEDERWHMGIVNDSRMFPDFPRCPQDIAAMMAANEFAVRNNATLTIRQAKWIARVRPVVDMIYGEVTGVPKRLMVAESIRDGVRYANHERLCEATESHKPFDFSGMDKRIGSGISWPIELALGDGDDEADSCEREALAELLGMHFDQDNEQAYRKWMYAEDDHLGKLWKLKLRELEALRREERRIGHRLDRTDARVRSLERAHRDWVHAKEERDSQSTRKARAPMADHPKEEGR